MSKARSYDDDDDDEDVGDEPDGGYPTIVGLAAGARILFGCLILLSGGVNVIIQLTQGAAIAGGPGGQPGQAAGAAVGGLCALVLVLLFGGAFVFVGIQTLRGTAVDTLGNAIGSLVFGVGNLGCGGVILVGGVALGGPVAIAAFIGGIVNVTAGLGLVAAGVMALVGRTPYLAWRRSQKRRR